MPTSGNTPKVASVHAFPNGSVEFVFAEGVEMASLPEVLQSMQLRIEGSSIWINGTRLSGSEVPSASVRPGELPSLLAA